MTHTTYKKEFIIIFTNGQILTMHLEKIGRRYFWASELYEIAIAIEDPEIVDATPIDLYFD